MWYVGFLIVWKQDIRGRKQKYRNLNYSPPIPKYFSSSFYLFSWHFSLSEITGLFCFLANCLLSCSIYKDVKSTRLETFAVFIHVPGRKDIHPVNIHQISEFSMFRNKEKQLRWA